MESATAEDTRTCTCHPDDKPPVPCPRQFALRDCRRAALLTATNVEIAGLENIRYLAGYEQKWLSYLRRVREVLEQ
jgi:hypothetical protein